MRRRIRVRGLVQGVGFRPFVYGLAHGLGLSGTVRNRGDGVEIEVQGPGALVDHFGDRLTGEPPPLARIDAVDMEAMALRSDDGVFHIAASEAGAVRTGPPPDAAVCMPCLRELFDTDDRRYRYPFVNCTDCGPRATIIRTLPYDRLATSMAEFALCPQCRSEYEDPTDRRFHAQPVACPTCGPRLRLVDGSGQPIGDLDAMATAWTILRDGGILAVKGLGGFHLMGDATQPSVVARLRALKRRPTRPFAVMAANLPSARMWVDTSDGETLLVSAARPIVLLPRRDEAAGVVERIAPGLTTLGVLLPYTPVHYLLFHEAAGRPPGVAWLDRAQPALWICTSANRTGAPLMIDSGEVCEGLGAEVDGILTHDRTIVARADDSVVRPCARKPIIVRRARGYADAAFMADTGPPVLALGADLKNTICIIHERRGYLSPHIGDLGHPDARRALSGAIDRLAGLIGTRPAVVVHDLHPDGYGGLLARRLADEWGADIAGVQHHHAHIAAVAAEHKFAGRLLGWALDGFGWGPGNAAWGGELLLLEGSRVARVGHLRPLALAGLDQAAREPWRMAAAVLVEMGRAEEVARRFGADRAWAIETALARSGLTTSAGRLFDAVAALLGGPICISYEGEAAMWLEGVARRHGPCSAWREGYRIAPEELDMRPLLARLVDEPDAGRGAALFHATLAHGLAAMAVQYARDHGVMAVALGGGCFGNEMLSTMVRTHLADAGIMVLEARSLPSNDGGISAGQAWVALRAQRGE